MFDDNSTDLAVASGSGLAMASSSPYPLIFDDDSPSSPLPTNMSPALLVTAGVNASDLFYIPNLQLRHSIPVTVLLSLLAGIISLTTIFGNTLVLVAFLLDRSLRQPGNYLIASLASADLLIGIFSMPLYTLYLLLNESWPLGWITCDLWLSLDYTVCLVSQYTVFYITLDRFLVVKFTATYRLWLTTKRAKLIVAGIWIGSGLLFFPSIIGWQFFVGERTVPPNNCYAQFMENPLFNTILVILYYWVTLIVISILYTFIYRKAWEMETRRKAEHKRAQMVHIQLAQATLGKLGTAGGSNTPTKKRKQSAPSFGVNRALLSETTDDEENRSSSSSQSTNLNKPKAASKSRIRVRALSALTTLSAIPAALPPPVPNSTLVKESTDEDQSETGNQSFSLSYKVNHDPDSKAPNVSSQQAYRKNQPKRTLFLKKRDSKKPPEAEPIIRPSSAQCNVTDKIEAPEENQSKDDMSMYQAAPITGMRRSYSDLEPVLTAAGLLRVPVDELIGIEFIDDDDDDDDDDDGDGKNKASRTHKSPFSGNAIYRLRIDPSLKKKSATFENLRSARSENAIRVRINRLLKGTRQRVSNGFCARNGSIVKSSSTNSDEKTDGVRKTTRSRSIFGIISLPSKTNVNSLASSLMSAANNKDKAKNKVYRSRAHKALRMISFILGVFVITWTPYHILAIIKGFCNECVNDTLYAVSYWFCYLNSPINPICYAVANKHFKRAFVKILRGNFKRTI